MEWKYSNIDHRARQELGLRMDEYAVLDFIYRVQTYPKVAYPGWCDLSYREISKTLGVPVGTLHGMMDRLGNRGFLVCAENLKAVTSDFYDHAYLNSPRSELEQKRSESEHPRSELEQKRSESEHPRSELEQKRSESEQHIEKERNNYKEEKREKRNRFSTPSVSAISEYMQERGVGSRRAAAEAEKMHDHFESNGWKVGGKTKMKDWKAAARNWIRRMGDFSDAPVPRPHATPPAPALPAVDREATKARLAEMQAAGKWGNF